MQEYFDLWENICRYFSQFSSKGYVFRLVPIQKNKQLDFENKISFICKNKYVVGSVQEVVICFEKILNSYKIYFFFNNKLYLEKYSQPHLKLEK